MIGKNGAKTKWVTFLSKNMHNSSYIDVLFFIYMEY